jgi:OPT family oligopeptide transporter
MSPAYIGQGIIMGFPTTMAMLLGAILGWGILAPLSKAKGWAPGEIGDWRTGGRGWILWISLGIMLADCLVGLTVVTIKTLVSLNQHRYQRLDGEGKDDDDAPDDQRVSTRTTLIGLLASSILCIVAVKIVFTGVPVYAVIVAIAIALPLSVLGVRALGETDLNPVSGIGKVSQLIFAVIIPRSNPRAIIINLIAGGIAEAGAQQAGDLMQDLKTGHLLGASPKVQFYGQLIGSLWSAIISAGIYKLYTRVYEIPGPLFQIPTAQVRFQTTFVLMKVWLDCARLVNNEGLPPHVMTPTIVLSLIFGVITLFKTLGVSHAHLLPSGLAAAVGTSTSPQTAVSHERNV